jgi:hypothetical protein
MRPDAVMDAEQKKAHFRKYYSKKEKQSKMNKKKPQSEEVGKDPKSNRLRKIVRIELRTPERRNFDEDQIFLDHLQSSTSIYQNENYMTGSNVPHSSSIINGYNQNSGLENINGIHPLPVEDFNQSSVQLTDLDNINKETLFFWNSVNPLN